MYSDDLLHESFPGPHEITGTDSPLMLSEAPVPGARVPAAIGGDASTASQYGLKCENTKLRQRLEEVLRERDEAREVVNAMRGIVG
jgi:hypothetical protein